MTVPDGQTLSNLGMWPTRLNDKLQKYHDKGILLSYHGVNTWWHGYPSTPRPAYLHCLPIGLGVCVFLFKIDLTFSSLFTTKNMLRLCNLCF